MNSPNYLISAEYARHILRETQEPPHDPERDCWTDPAMADMARTVIAQAEQIKRLQAGMRELAEETYEYGVQSRELDPIDGWLPWTFTIPFHKGRTMESCQRFIEGRSGHNFEYRLVQRRVSPVKVVE